MDSQKSVRNARTHNTVAALSGADLLAAAAPIMFLLFWASGGSVAKIHLMLERAPKNFSGTFEERFQVASFSG